jgi:hypothetical protein
MVDRFLNNPDTAEAALRPLREKILTGETWQHRMMVVLQKWKERSAV